jgi:hypothetical protein
MLAEIMHRKSHPSLFTCRINPKPRSSIPDNLGLRFVEGINGIRRELDRSRTPWCADLPGTVSEGHDAQAEWAKQHGYVPCIISENIAYQYRTSGFTDEELAREFFQTMRLPNSRALYDVPIANHVPRRLTRVKALL